MRANLLLPGKKRLGNKANGFIVVVARVSNQNKLFTQIVVYYIK